jgi:glutamate racemase
MIMNNNTQQKLLVLDWGIGGLPLFQKLKTALPKTSMVYLSDSGSVPYGKQSSEQLHNRLEEIARFAKSLGITTIAIACNAMSSILSSAAASMESVEVLSLMHSFLPRQLPTNKRIGIIGGKRTIESGIYQKAFVDAGNIVHAEPTQELSALIEAGSFESIPDFLEKTFSRLGKINSLVLACTHYPAASTIIQKMHPKLNLIDPIHALFDECTKRFIQDDVAAKEAAHKYYTTGDASSTMISAGKAFGFHDLPFEKIPLNLSL